MRRLLPALCLGLCAAACGDNEIHQYRRDLGPTDSFSAKITAHQQSWLRTSCDQQYAAVQRRIGEELDKRRDYIDRYITEATPRGQGEPLGPVTLAPFAPVPPVREQFAEHTTGWGEAELVLGDALADATPLAWYHWQDLYGLTYSLIFDDINRRAGLSMGLDENSLEHVRNLQGAVDRCLAEPACTALDLAPAVTAHVSRDNRVYAEIWARFTNGTTRSLKRQVLRELAQHLQMDLSFYGFVVNDTITTEGTSLILPLDAGEFAGYEATLQEIIEAAWRGPHVQVKVRWVSRDQVPGAYRFVGHPEVKSGRAHVSHGQRTINLYPGTHRQVIAHELGHVLGLPDHYYTLWEPEQCAYRIRIDNTDIMSNHMSGRVTAGEWAELRHHYEIGDNR